MNKSLSVSPDGKKLVIGGDGNLFMWEFMSDNDLSALEQMKSSQIPPDQMVLLKQIYDDAKKTFLNDAEMSVFVKMHPFIQAMLKSIFSIRADYYPIIEGPFAEEKSSEMRNDQTDKALKLGSYLKQSDVTSPIKNNETGYVQRLLSLIKYYLSVKSS